MSLIVVALLFGIAYVLLEVGLPFVALVVFLVGILSALTSKTAPSGAAGLSAAQKQRPIIVTSSGGAIPDTIKLAAKHTWDGSDGYSDFLTYLGGAVAWPFRIVARIITGKTGKTQAGDH
ncbi:hypothetical protein HY572_04855 [Candidatus Micrarchaeota archaeon]|nr:hypothetical protein [Candidatus Micrarchaeota archaeon]